MPIPTITQNPGVVWDQVSTFPFLRQEDICPFTPAMQTGRYTKSIGNQLRQGSIADSFMGATNSSAGGSFTLRADAGGPPYAQCSAAGAGQFRFGLDAFRAPVDTGSGPALAAGAEHATETRVWWLKWLMRSTFATPDALNGIIVAPSSTAAQLQWPDRALPNNNHGGWGFVGDGAGQWRYASYDRAGVLLLREAIALPAHVLTEWNQFELMVISERAGLAATLEIWFNGVLVATRNWTGALLEDYIVNESYFLPMLGGGSQAAGGGATDFLGITMHRGAFTRTGVAV